MKNHAILFIALGLLAGAVSLPSAATSGADYFPVLKDNIWEYDVMIPGNNGGLQDFGDATWTITGDTVIGGRTLFVVESQVTYYFGMGDTTVIIYLLSEGNDVLMTNAPESPTSPVKIGQHTYTGSEQWEADGKQLQVYPCGTYTVSGETFNLCYCVISDGTDTASVYAPDVGPVRMTMSVSGITLHFLLKAYQVSVPLASNDSPFSRHRAQSLSPFTADNSSRIISFDGRGRNQAVLSVYRADGRRVRQYRIAGMGAIQLDSGTSASGGLMLKLERDGKSYTGSMRMAK